MMLCFHLIGYIDNQLINESINLFYEIKNPNDIIFILLFNACAQLETNEALNLVKTVSTKMPTSFYSNPHLLTSLLDALMKCGDVETAEILFNKVKIKEISMYGAMMKGMITRRFQQMCNVIDQFRLY